MSPGEPYQAIDRPRIEADYPDPFVAIKVLSRNAQRMTGAVRILRIDFASDEPIIALESVSGHDVRIDDLFFRGT